MSQNEGRDKTDRRSFLKLAGLGTVTGGVALATAGGDAEAKEASDGKSGGYRETGHVKKFYETARF